MPGDWQDRNAYFGGAPQSLTGDLIRDGVTGAAGHVAEPYLDATIRPDILFPAYVRGANLAEAFYAAMPYLSWQTIVVGDPLCAPFRRQTLTDHEIDPGLDESTDLPAYFSLRRLSAFPSTLQPEAKAAFVKAEVRFGRGEREAAVALLEKAVELEPQFTAARILLASNADALNEFDNAIAQYRAIVAYAPNNPIALNNLAFDLAVHANSAADALPFAERVNKLAPNTPPFLDTLAWTQHLLGHDSEAVTTITAARTGAPYSADIRWHAAVIFAAVKDQARALNELQAALKLNPAMADRADVKELQRQLGAK
jgi:tetratricopeptide (TPR) repeat protein